jgi:hypothetical protein
MHSAPFMLIRFEAIGRNFFRACCLSFSASKTSLTTYTLLAIAHIEKNEISKIFIDSELKMIPAPKAGAKISTFLDHCLGLKTAK